MKKYNYYYNKQDIRKAQFLAVVPHDWEKYIVNGEYNFGCYRAVEI